MFSPLIFEEANVRVEDILEDHNLLPSSKISGKKRERKSSAGIEENKNIEGGNNEYCKDKKVMHRENERQRRQEMANLYATLRSLLPHQYIKGKRSTSDHMNEAVNYIEQMQIEIKKLQCRKDKLKKMPNTGTSPVDDILSSSDSPSCVVNSCLDCVEILISTRIKEEEFPLSRVLVELLERGLNVVNCVSTTANERSLHRIQAKAINPASIDPSMLQERLAIIVTKLG